MLDAQRPWRSLDDLHGIASVPDGGDDEPARWSRRRFLALMGASAALTGLSGCRWPREEAAPFAHRPTGTEPGAAKFFATSMEVDGSAQPLLVTCLDGRPIKIEGNPAHPACRGASGIHAQASLLELYDPDRGQGPSRRSTPASWEELDRALAVALGATAQGYGQGLVVVSERISSPTTARLRDLFRRRFSRAQWIEWEPVTRDHESQGLHAIYGAPTRQLLDLQHAKVVVSLESDLFSGHPDALRHARDWAEARDPGSGHPPRLYAIESAFTLTGAMADSRLPARTAELRHAAALLYAAVARARGQASGGAAPPRPSHALAELLDRAVQDLLAAGPEGLIVAGPTLPVELHAIVAATNALLGNRGVCRRVIPDPSPPITSAAEALEEVQAHLLERPADCLVILGGNPAYDCPLDFARAIASAKTSVHFSLYQNETSVQCGWYAPRAHGLESWGDAVNWDGSLCAIQPMIAPLFDGRTMDEFLARMMQLETNEGHDLVRETWKESGDWDEFLRLGFRTRSLAEVAEGAPPPDLLGEAARVLSQPDSPGLDVLFRADPRVHDGRFGNNPWLQELPDPLTNLTWGNAALLDPVTADEHSLSTGDFIAITSGKARIQLPAYVMPGQAPGTIVLPLGYGRTMAGRAAKDTGWDVQPLRQTEGLWHLAGVRLERAAGRHEFACTSDHYLIDSLGLKERERRGGELVRETSFVEHAQHPGQAARPPHVFPPADLWESPMPKSGHQWAMSIDLNRCNGCSACVVACQAENNIPVVGPDQVRRGREMHWLRIDRIYRGSVENPKVRHQPMTCLHCENAPCEQVCPVAATMHSSDGLNEMVYNRCIGTRYCSNNCPVKVRRFNYYNYYGKLDELEKMRMNPEVTVRNRGVMEKCSLCIQRIAKARIEARIADRHLVADSIQPACAQACPARAIQFGDLSEAESEFVKQWTGPRAYEILEGLKLGARVRYLVRLHNTHPDLREAISTHESGHG